MAMGKKTGGRRKGTPNKATLERIEREKIGEQIAAAARQPGAGKAVAKAMDANHLWAKDELVEVIPILKGIVAHFQKVPFAAVNSNGNVTKADWDALYKWLTMYIDTNMKLAPYQSPTFRAVFVQEAPAAASQTIIDGKVLDLTARKDPASAAAAYLRLIRAEPRAA